MTPFSIRQRIGVGINYAHPLANRILAAYPMSPWYTKIYDAKGGLGINWTAPALQEPVPDVDSTGSFARYASRAITDQGAYFDLGTSPLAGLGTGSYMVHHNVYGTSQPYAVIGDENAADNNSSLEFFGYNSGNVWARSYIGGVQKTISGGTVSAHTWYQSIITYDGATFALYVNAALIASTSASGTMGNPGNGLHLGRRGDVTSGGGTWPWFGGVRNVVFFNKALTPSEVYGLYRDPYAIYARPAPPRYGLTLAATTSLSRWFLMQ